MIDSTARLAYGVEIDRQCRAGAPDALGQYPSHSPGARPTSRHRHPSPTVTVETILDRSASTSQATVQPPTVTRIVVRRAPWPRVNEYTPAGTARRARSTSVPWLLRPVA